MRTSRRLITALTAAFLFLAVLSPAPALTIKPGSLAPEGSPWDAALKRVALEWNRISGGRITRKIHPGGIAGKSFSLEAYDRIRCHLAEYRAAAAAGSDDDGGS